MSALAKPSLENPTDAARGASEDTTELYEEVVPLAFRTLRRLGVPDASLPDAVQDVLLVVHRRRHEFRAESSLRTWVFGIVVRVASNYRRKQRRASAVFEQDEFASERASSAQPNPFEQLAQAEAGRLLHRLLDELPEEQREVLVLVELEELPIPAAAESLGISLSTCRSYLKTARRWFNAAVERERAKALWRAP